MEKKSSNLKNVKKKLGRPVGRPVGSGVFREPTKQVNIPTSMVPEVIDLLEEFCKEKELGKKCQSHILKMKKKFSFCYKRRL